MRSTNHHGVKMQIETAHRGASQTRCAGMSLDRAAGDESDPKSTSDQGKLEILVPNFGNEAELQTIARQRGVENFAGAGTLRFYDPG